MNKSRIWTKGDANFRDDTWISNKGFLLKTIQGKVIFTLPQMGLPILYIKETWLGKVSLTLILLVGRYLHTIQDFRIVVGDTYSSVSNCGIDCNRRIHRPAYSKKFINV